MRKEKGGQDIKQIIQDYQTCDALRSLKEDSVSLYISMLIYFKAYN